MEFLYWKEVQQRLTDHVQATGELYSFYDAMRELWEEGACHTAPELPEIPADAWDGADAREIGRLLDMTPVRMDHFVSGFQKRDTAQQYTAFKHDRAIRPIRVAKDQRLGLHTHTAIEVGCVLRGDGVLVLKDGGRKLPENSFFMVAPNVEHDLLAARNSLIIVFSLSRQVVEDTLYRMLEKESVLSRFFRDSMGPERAGCLIIEDVYPEKVLPFLRGILREYYREREYCDTAVESYLSLLLVHLLRYSGNYRRFEQEQRSGSAPMLAILKYIQTNYRTATLAGTAAHFHYAMGYLSKLIKRTTGKNFTAIVGELRIEEAKELLTETELSVEEVGIRTGYESPVHFSRSFKQAVGDAPSVYRRKNRP